MSGLILFPILIAVIVAAAILAKLFCNRRDRDIL